MRQGLQCQRGLSLIAAIFLIVVMAALAGFAASVYRVQQSGAALDLEGSRVLQAAQAGIDWGAYQVLMLAAPGCAAATNLAFPAATSLVRLAATVGCTSSAHTEGGNPVNIYRLTVTACNQPAAGACPNPAPGPDYVERQLVATVER